MAVALFGGLCVLVALSQDRPPPAKAAGSPPIAAGEGAEGLQSGLMPS